MTEEQFIAMQLADLHREYRDRAQPLLNRLASLEAMKPPKPIYIDASMLPEFLRMNPDQSLTEPKQ